MPDVMEAEVLQLSFRACLVPVTLEVVVQALAFGGCEDEGRQHALSPDASKGIESLRIRRHPVVRAMVVNEFLKVGQKAHGRLIAVRSCVPQVFCTLAWTIFPPCVVQGCVAIYHSPSSSVKRFPSWSCVGRVGVVVAGAGVGRSSCFSGCFAIGLEVTHHLEVCNRWRVGEWLSLAR